MKSIKIKDYLEFVKPAYIYLKLTPHNSVKNSSSHNIARAISILHKNFAQCVKVEQSRLIKVLGREFLIGTKYSIALNPKVSYYVYMEKRRIEFYFLVPQQYESIIREKILNTWSAITVKQVDNIPLFSSTATKYQLGYAKEDGLSLAVDKRSNVLLESNLNIVDIMEEKDKVGIFYNFIPLSQHSWLAEYKATMNKIRKDQPVNKNKIGVGYLLKLLVSLISTNLDELGEVIGGRSKYRVVRQGSDGEITIDKLLSIKNNVSSIMSGSTLAKARSTVIGAQVLVLSESPDRLRQHNNAKSLAQSFDSISEDNSLRHKSYRGRFGPLDKMKIACSKASTDECSNFLALPGRELLERYKFIDKIDTLESEVPDELLKGVMSLGTNTCRGDKQKAYVSNDKEYRMLSLVVCGPNRSGKTKFFANIARDAIAAGECVIIPDYIGSCQLSEEIATAIPKAQVLEIRCDNWDTLQGLGYNEVPPSINPFEQYKNAKEQTALLMTLVDSINAETANFTARMGRYFEAAALTVFLTNGNIKDVFAVLMNHKTRKLFIDKIPKAQGDNMEEYVDYLEELDAIEKNQVVGTKMHLITGAVDRLQKLKVNAYIEMMLKKGSKGNINLVDEMQKNQLIVIKMPQRMFLTDNEKDVYVTYWMTKIWLSVQIREAKFTDRNKMLKVNLLIDEIYQVKNSEKFLATKLSQLPKFNIKPIISCHYLNQLKLREDLRTANASYMLISGADKQNYAELKSELQPYSEEDLLNLKRFNSLNLIKCDEGYAKFITQLPAPITE